MTTDNQFDWVEFYKELASKLLQYKANRAGLVDKVKQIYETTGINMPTLEKDNQLVDIDPFTFFGLFNKSSMKEENRVKILSAIASLFSISAPVPTSFSSIPVLNNQNATFYYFVGDQEDRDIDDLWDLFESALRYANAPTAENRASLSKYFDLTIQKKGNGNSKIPWLCTGSRLTRFLIWISGTHGISMSLGKYLPPSFRPFLPLRARFPLPSTLTLLKNCAPICKATKVP